MFKFAFMLLAVRVAEVRFNMNLTDQAADISSFDSGPLDNWDSSSDYFF